MGHRILAYPNIKGNSRVYPEMGGDLARHGSVQMWAGQNDHFCTAEAAK